MCSNQVSSGFNLQNVNEICLKMGFKRVSFAKKGTCIVIKLNLIALTPSVAKMFNEVKYYLLTILNIQLIERGKLLEVKKS